MARRASSDARPILCGVFDAAQLGDDPGRFARGLFRSGLDWLQLRERTLDSHALWQLARILIAAAPAHDRDRAPGGDGLPRGCVLLNKRVDIAWASGAAGVHLGFDGLAAERAASLLPKTALIGASLHSRAEVERAAAGALRYAHLAPIWNPRSKPATRPALGPDCLAQAARAGLPLIAQGGLDPARARAAIRAGARGIAVTGILTHSQDPMATVAQLRQALDEAVIAHD